MNLSDIKGIGEKRIESLKARGILTPFDLINLIPRRYIDVNLQSQLSEEKLGEQVVVGIVTAPPVAVYISKRHTTRVAIDVNGSKMTAMWFNQPYMKNNIKEGEQYKFTGKLSISKNGFYMASPKFQLISDETVQSSQNGEIVPLYQRLEGIPENVVKEGINCVLSSCEITSVLPKDVEKDLGLISLKSGYEKMHHPASLQDGEEGVKRVKFEGALNSMLNFDFEYKKGRREWRLKVDLLSKIWLPHIMTQSQVECVKTVAEEISQGLRVNRLIQGDVGSGKTLVMFAIATLLARLGHQTAILCPTRTLATQHYNNFVEIAKRNGVNAVLLTSDTLTPSILASIEHGEVQVIIGTHTLFSEKVRYKNLFMAIIDEQQKFGVSERQRLVSKGNNVHILSATATPIPRTLSLMTYGEINVSEIKKRYATNNISTHIISSSKLDDMFEFFKSKLDMGQFAYIVCPKINENGEDEGAISMFEKAKKVFENYSVGLLHGAMSSQERDEITKKFRDGQFQVLVATSLIEVGIDNKNATLIYVQDADMFGLSSLHQLRGRVGRNGQESFCFLSVKNLNDKVANRLKMFKKTLDGFEIAELDLSLRGAGDIMGRNQHGNSVGNLAELSLPELKQIAEIANRIKRGISSDMPLPQSRLVII